MTTNVKIFAGAFALACAYDLGHFIARRNAVNAATKVVTELAETNFDLAANNAALQEQSETLHGEVRYLVHTLNRCGITLDRLDLEALPHVQIVEK